MPYASDWIDANNASRARLAKLAALDDAAYLLPVSDEWTIGMSLAHVAFWDRRALFVIERWEREGASDAAIDSDSINGALEAFLPVIPPHASYQLAQQVAQELDRKLEALPDDLVNYLTTTNPFAPIRATHRNEHLDQIEAALSKR